MAQRPRQATRGVRNNNPGNMQDGRFTKSQPGYVGNDGRFARFDTMEHGIEAHDRLIANSYRGNSVRQAYARLAPSASENPEGIRQENINRFARQLGLSPDTPIPDQLLPRFAALLRNNESGIPVREGRMSLAQNAQSVIPGIPVPVLPEPVTSGGMPGLGTLPSFQSQGAMAQLPTADDPFDLQNAIPSAFRPAQEDSNGGEDQGMKQLMDSLAEIQMPRVNIPLSRNR